MIKHLASEWFSNLWIEYEYDNVSYWSEGHTFLLETDDSIRVYDNIELSI